jgi:dihydrolipoamide dehydrogenase
MLAKQGMEFKLGAKVTGVEKSGKGAKVSFEPVKGGDAETIDADIVLVATGRKPYTEGLGLEDAGVVLDERGRVRTDHHYQTNVPGSTPSAMSSPVRCWRTRPRTKAWRWPRSWPARRVT